MCLKISFIENYRKKLLFEGALPLLHLVGAGKLVDERSFLKDKVILPGL